MICIYQVIPGASQKNPDLVTNSGPIPDHFWHLGPDPDQVRNSGPYRSHWLCQMFLKQRANFEINLMERRTTWSPGEEGRLLRPKPEK